MLLLQGPVGPFFCKLQEFLEYQGFDCLRVSFNPADRLFAGKERRLDFSAGANAWQGWLANELDRFDHVVLFGSNRPAHAIARKLARQKSVHLLSLEEGYIRPGYVTVEHDGNNADSPVARKLPPHDFPAELERPQAMVANARQSFRAMCGYAAAAYATRTVFSTRRERELFHRPISALPDTVQWMRNYARHLTGRTRDLAAIQTLLEHHDRQYFLVPLQVATDAQMGKAACGWTTRRLIGETLAAFAHSGLIDHHLVFKVHPLDRGHTNARREIARTAARLGISDRVITIETGSLGLLVRHSAGMITINSTSGLSAIFHGVPLLVIGNALYAHPSLASVAFGHPDFQSFWHNGFVADRKLRRRYLSWIRSESLHPGDFYTTAGMALACEGVLKRLTPARACQRQFAASEI